MLFTNKVIHRRKEVVKNFFWLIFFSRNVKSLRSDSMSDKLSESADIRPDRLTVVKVALPVPVRSLFDYRLPCSSASSQAWLPGAGWLW